jgi:hypothetical protein
VLWTRGDHRGEEGNAVAAVEVVDALVGASIAEVITRRFVRDRHDVLPPLVEMPTERPE